MKLKDNLVRIRSQMVNKRKLSTFGRVYLVNGCGEGCDVCDYDDNDDNVDNTTANGELSTDCDDDDHLHQ